MSLPERKNHRLSHYDYGKSGYYFITICTNKRLPLLSVITSREQNEPSVSDTPIVGSGALTAPQPLVTLTPFGEMVLESWNRIETINENIAIDKYVFMPDHIHGIIRIDNPDKIQHPKGEFDFQVAERWGHRSLPGVIRDFKSVTTRHYKSMFHVNESLWQDSYFDTVIRTQEQYIEIWNYIENNPRKWLFEHSN
jgi:REP element-mobilizing transposase RayT